MNQDNSHPILQIRSLGFNYGPVGVLRDITLDVQRGEIVAVIGPNGAGKSTLIKVLSGVLKASVGEVLIDQRNVSSYSPSQRARAVAVVPQARQLGGSFSVEQAVLLGRTAYLGFLGKPSPADVEKVQWAMEQTDVVCLADRKLAEISGGEQQRVLLARALAQDTAVLLLDEPTNHLDLRYQVNLLKLIKKLVLQEGISVLMAMHDLNQVSGIADRVALLSGGQLIALGTPEEVLTPAKILQAYQTEIETISHPKTNKPMIFPAG